MPMPKRSRQSYRRTKDRNDKAEAAEPAYPPAAFARAYEADLHRGEPPPADLIRWAGEGPEVWADRYDVLHLLTELPDPSAPRASSSSSLSSSWSLPSDAEETFDLSSDEELAEHARNRRQAWVDGLREARLRERELQDQEEEEKRTAELEMAVGETPPDDVLTLMKHTAKSLAASPNAAVLEMRIMTRHSNDERFAFFRAGNRWSKEWARQRAAAVDALHADRRARIHGQEGGAGSRNTARPGPSSGAGMGGLVGDYDSDSNSGSDSSHRHSPAPTPPPPDEAPPPPPPGPPPPSPPPPPPE